MHRWERLALEMSEFVLGQDYEDGADMVAEALQGGPALPFVQFCLRLRSSRYRSLGALQLAVGRRATGVPGGRDSTWLLQFEARIFSVWRLLRLLASPAAPVPYKPMGDISRSQRRSLSRATGTVAYSEPPMAQRCLLQVACTGGDGRRTSMQCGNTPVTCTMLVIRAPCLLCVPACLLRAQCT